MRDTLASETTTFIGINNHNLKASENLLETSFILSGRVGQVAARRAD